MLDPFSNAFLLLCWQLAQNSESISDSLAALELRLTTIPASAAPEQAVLGGLPLRSTSPVNRLASAGLRPASPSRPGEGHDTLASALVTGAMAKQLEEVLSGLGYSVEADMVVAPAVGPGPELGETYIQVVGRLAHSVNQQVTPVGTVHANPQVAPVGGGGPCGPAAACRSYH